MQGKRSCGGKCSHRGGTAGSQRLRRRFRDFGPNQRLGMCQDLLVNGYFLGDAGSSPAPSVVAPGGARKDGLTYRRVIRLCRRLVTLLAGGGGGAAGAQDAAADTNGLRMAVFFTRLTVGAGVNEGLGRDNAGILFEFLCLDSELMFEGVELGELLGLGSSLRCLPFGDEGGCLPVLEVALSFLKSGGLKRLEVGVVKALCRGLTTFNGSESQRRLGVGGDRSKGVQGRC